MNIDDIKDADDISGEYMYRISYGNDHEQLIKEGYEYMKKYGNNQFFIFRKKIKIDK